MDLSNPATGPRISADGDPYGDGEPIPARTLELAHSLAEAWGLHAPAGSYEPGPDFDLDPLAPADYGVTHAGGYPDVSALRVRLGLS